MEKQKLSELYLGAVDKVFDCYDAAKETVLEQMCKHPNFVKAGIVGLLVSSIACPLQESSSWHKRREQAQQVWQRKTSVVFEIQYALFDKDGNGTIDEVVMHSRDFVSPRGGMPSFTRTYSSVDGLKMLEQEKKFGMYRIK